MSGETVFAEVVRYTSTGKVVFRYPNGECHPVGNSVNDAKEQVDRASGM